MAIMAIVLTLMHAGVALAQVNELTVTVPTEHVGLAGVVRPGTWMPIRVMIDNPAPEPRDVVVQWTLSDSDGDAVQSRRRVSLSPQRSGQAVWVYGCPPMGTTSQTVWQIDVLEWRDGRAGRRLAPTLMFKPGRVIETHVRAIGVSVNGYLGLDPFEEDVTQHEPCEYLRGLSAASGLMPDRWHGLSLMESYVWAGGTDAGGDPGDAAVPSEAIRQWVRRGGHLVIMLSNSLGWESWSKSPMAGMLPTLTAERIEGQKPPGWFGKQRPDTIDYFRLQPSGAGTTTVLLEDDAGRPVVVAAGYGFGRVTVIGIDLTDPKVFGTWLPYGQENLWNTVFSWRSPALARAVVQAKLAGPEPEFHRPMIPGVDELGRFIPAQVSRSQTVAAALLLAMLVFALYWLAAGPIGFAVLRGKGLMRHSWVVFVGIVAVFSVVTWGGAMVLRPTTAAITHLSVLDIDGATRQVRTRSWLSMFVPEHGTAEVLLDPDSPDGGGHLVASPGFDPGRPGIGFVDQQSYVIDAAAPERALRTATEEDTLRSPGLDLPVRATTKTLALDYMGPLPHDSKWLTADWVMPVGDIRVVNHLPVGKLRHALPGTLRNTCVFYCPGGGESPWVQNTRSDWAPDTDLVVNLAGAQRLLIPARRGQRWGGWLGELVAAFRGEPTPQDVHGFGGVTQPEDEPKAIDAGRLMTRLWMLSFFGTLPPPEYEVPVKPNQPNMPQFRDANFARSVGRETDLTPATGLRRLIIMGLMENAPLPAPMSVNGRTLDADGWVLVRWHLDLE